jgi:bacterioferritin (cytochrome b1)
LKTNYAKGGFITGKGAGEMRHAKQSVDRIEELGGEPTSELADKAVKG